MAIAGFWFWVHHAITGHNQVSAGAAVATAGTGKDLHPGSLRRWLSGGCQEGSVAGLEASVPQELLAGSWVPCQRGPPSQQGSWLDQSKQGNGEGRREQERA